MRIRVRHRSGGRCWRLRGGSRRATLRACDRLMARHMHFYQLDYDSNYLYAAPEPYPKDWLEFMTHSHEGVNYDFRQRQRRR